MFFCSFFHRDTSFSVKLCDNTKKSIIYHTFCLAVMDFLFTFAEKFIMSDYGTERDNKTAARDTLPDPTGSC